jgi:hypothetical protein
MKSEGEKATKISLWRNGRKKSEKQQIVRRGSSAARQQNPPKVATTREIHGIPFPRSRGTSFGQRQACYTASGISKTENAHLRSSLAFLERGISREDAGSGREAGSRRLGKMYAGCIHMHASMREACCTTAAIGEKNPWIVLLPPPTTDSKWQGVNQNRAGVYAGMQVAKKTCGARADDTAYVCLLPDFEVRTRLDCAHVPHRHPKTNATSCPGGKSSIENAAPSCTCLSSFEIRGRCLTALFS